MTSKQLNDLFAAHSCTARDFIAWAAGFGVTVHDSTVSRHRSGAQGITGPWQIAYHCYFTSLNPYSSVMKKRIKEVALQLEELERLIAHNEGAGIEQEVHSLQQELEELLKAAEEQAFYNDQCYGHGHW